MPCWFTACCPPLLPPPSTHRHRHTHTNILCELHAISYVTAGVKLCVTYILMWEVFSSVSIYQLHWGSPNAGGDGCVCSHLPIAVYTVIHIRKCTTTHHSRNCTLRLAVAGNNRIMRTYQPQCLTYLKPAINSRPIHTNSWTAQHQFHVQITCTIHTQPSISQFFSVSPFSPEVFHSFPYSEAYNYSYYHRASWQILAHA